MKLVVEQQAWERAYNGQIYVLTKYAMAEVDQSTWMWSQRPENSSFSLSGLHETECTKLVDAKQYLYKIKGVPTSDWKNSQGRWYSPDGRWVIDKKAGTWRVMLKDRELVESEVKFFESRKSALQFIKGQ